MLSMNVARPKLYMSFMRGPQDLGSFGNPNLDSSETFCKTKPNHLPSFFPENLSENYL